MNAYLSFACKNSRALPWTLKFQSQCLVIELRKEFFRIHANENARMVNCTSN